MALSRIQGDQIQVGCVLWLSVEYRETRFRLYTVALSRIQGAQIQVYTVALSRIQGAQIQVGCILWLSVEYRETRFMWAVYCGSQ